MLLWWFLCAFLPQRERVRGVADPLLPLSSVLLARVHGSGICRDLVTQITRFLCGKNGTKKKRTGSSVCSTRQETSKRQAKTSCIHNLNVINCDVFLFFSISFASREKEQDSHARRDPYPKFDSAADRLEFFLSFCFTLRVKPPRHFCAKSSDAGSSLRLLRCQESRLLFKFKQLWLDWNIYARI